MTSFFVIQQVLKLMGSRIWAQSWIGQQPRRLFWFSCCWRLVTFGRLTCLSPHLWCGDPVSEMILLSLQDIFLSRQLPRTGKSKLCELSQYILFRNTFLRRSSSPDYSGRHAIGLSETRLCECGEAQCQTSDWHLLNSSTVFKLFRR